MEHGNLGHRDPGARLPVVGLLDGAVVVMLADSFSSWWPGLVRFALRQIHDPAVAEDLAGEAILRCLRAEASGRAVNRAYAYMIVGNLVRDRWRRQHETRVGELLPLDVDPQARAVDPGLRMECAWLLEQLRPNEARACELQAAGYDCHEIGAELGITRDAVKSTLWRAHRRARRLAG